MAQIIYDPSPTQERFHFSLKPQVLMLGGKGSGKSYSLTQKLFQLAGKNPGVPGGLLCPTLKMFKRDVLPLIKDLCRDNHIPYHFNKQDFYFEFPLSNSICYVYHDEDGGKNIAGSTLGWALINEVTLCSRDAHRELRARLRHPNTRFKQLAMSGTFEGFDWIYEDFIENPKESTEVLNISTRENKHVGDYVSILEDTYDATLQKAYIEGQIINFKGNRAVYSFDRTKDVIEDATRSDFNPTWVSIDFNVDPMSATLWNKGGIRDHYLIQAFDEICLPNSNTYKLCDVLKEKLNGDIDDVILYPDPAGKARSTRSDRSDIDILKQAGFTDIRYKNRIPSVRECLNATNNLFDKRRVKISKRCKNLIADLEQCVLKSEGLEIDKSNPKRSHWLDGMKNMIDYEFPIRPKPHSREQRIR